MDTDSEVRQEVQFLDKLGRHKALWLLVIGAWMGIIGFAFAAFAGFKSFKDQTINGLGQPYASGQPPFPLTVSEMVHDPLSPQGKAFLGFELLAAIMLLVSWYPYELSNVYVAVRHGLFVADDDHHDEGHCDCGGCLGNCFSWACMRHFLPALGLALVALVTTTPVYNRKSSNISWITVQIHSIAAAMLFGGYIIVEVQCLFVAYNRRFQSGPMKGQRLVRIRNFEWWIRTFFILVTAIAAVITIGIQFGYPAIPDDVICCDDNYTRVENISHIAELMGPEPSNPTLEDEYNRKAVELNVMNHYYSTEPIRIDTASGGKLGLKKLCFWAEVVAGVFGLGSMIVIWHFAPERALLLDDYIDFKALQMRDRNTDDDDVYDEFSEEMSEMGL